MNCSSLNARNAPSNMHFAPKKIHPRIQPKLQAVD